MGRLVVGAMQGYASACQEKQWFFEINLVTAFTSAAWSAFRLQARFHYKDVEELVQMEYEDRLDRCLLVKAIWDAASASFLEDSVRQKVYNSLYRSYDAALTEVC